MRDVKRLNRSMSRQYIVFGSVIMTIGCISIMTPRPASALTLQPINTLETIVHNTTTTVKEVITPSPKTPVATSRPQPTTTASMPAVRTATPHASVYQAPIQSRRTTPPPPVTRSVPTHAVIYPTQTIDSNLLQPFSLVKAWPGAFNEGVVSAMHPTDATDSMFIMATPAGWSIGGLLWYWWAGIVGAGVYAVRRRSRFLSDYKIKNMG